MITMVGNHICKDCVNALAVIEREHLPIEFHDMEMSLEYVKEFLKIREGNWELFEECRRVNGIGIPVFVMEDGAVTLDPEAAYEAARKVKNKTVVMLGSHLCKVCREKHALIKAQGLPVEFHDIVENLNDMRQFLKIREGNEKLYKDVREAGRVGIPVFILPDGTVTRDADAAMKAAAELK